MRVGIFDIETTGLYADDGIVLCMAHKPYLGPRSSVQVIRADKFPEWKTNKTSNGPVVLAIMKALAQYDILVAHNGEYFDKRWLTTACLKYGIPPALAFTKIIDPCLISRRKLRLHRNSLQSLIAYLGIKEQKTPVAFEHWLKASLDSNRDSMNYIVTHNIGDVITLDKVYDALRQVVKRIDDGGSSY